MNNTGKMADLLKHLMRERNGAVVESMERGGLHYPLSYGVSLPTVWKIAREYAPDHDFALYLYRQQVRELMLSAYVIADPTRVTAEELEFWAAGIVNRELAENFAFSLLSRTQQVYRALDCWGHGACGELLAYAALMALVKAFDRKADVPSRSSVAEYVRYGHESESTLLHHAAEMLEIRMESIDE